MEALLYRGELPRGEVKNLLGVSERQARRVVSALINRDVIVSETDENTAPSRLPRSPPPMSGCPGCSPRRRDEK